MRTRVLILAVVAGVVTCRAAEPADARPASAARVLADLQGRHVHGQTFLTWSEKSLQPRDRVAVYRHDAPVTSANIANATVLCGDLMPGTSCDFCDLRRAKYERFTPLPAENIRGAVVPWDGRTDEQGRPVPRRIAPYHGLYVHTPAARGKAYYAVQAQTADGTPLTPLQSGASALAEPVAETTTDWPRPILMLNTWTSRPDDEKSRSMSVTIAAIGIFQNDKKAQADWKKYKRTGRHYVLYGTKEHGWREGLPFQFSIYSEGKSFSLWPDDSNFAFMGFDNAWWFGVNDNITRPEKLAEGLVRPTHQARLLGLIDWAVAHFHVDRSTISGGGSSMGGTGTLLFILRHPKVFNRAWMSVPAVNLPELPNARKLAQIIWGPLDKPVRCSEGSTVWEALNAIWYLREHTVALPFCTISNGRKDLWMRWTHNPAFYTLLREQGQPCVVYWDNSGHGGSARGKLFRPLLRKLPRTAKDRPMLAFANGSRDSDSGNGDPADGDLVGCLNLGYWYEDLRESPNKVTVAYWFERAATEDLAGGAQDPSAPPQTDGGTVDLLVYRLQVFPHGPKARAAWRILDGDAVVRTGEVALNERGAFRIAGAPADKRYTLELRRPG